MILYRLACAHGHEFEAWFRSSAAFDAQVAEAAIACPVCGSTGVGKAPMSPRVRTDRKGREQIPSAEALVARHQASMVELMRTIRQELESRSEYVGPQFAEEARKIHFGETTPRVIHGEATSEQVADLSEEGIEVVALPRLPEDLN